MSQPAEKDVCAILDTDHLAVKHLFVDYARLAYAPEDEGDRAALAREICRQLESHTRLEEEVVYPAIREAVPSMADVVDEAEADHGLAKELIAQIRALGVADVAMDQRVAQLARIVEDHVKEERDELFPKLRASPRVDAQAFAQEVRQRQVALQQALPAD